MKVNRAVAYVLTIAVAFLAVVLIQQYVQTSAPIGLGIGAAPSQGQSDSTGCGDVGEVVDLAEPDPIERQRGPARVPALRSAGIVVDPTTLPPSIPLTLPELAGDETPQMVLRTDVDLDGDGRLEWIIQALYGTRPPGPNENIHEYIDAGGWYFEQRSGTGQNADAILAQMKDHGRTPPPPVVDIGPYKGVAGHSDPVLRNDLRPWHLYWSDGESDFAIQADRGAEFVVTTARSLYCP